MSSVLSEGARIAAARLADFVEEDEKMRGPLDGLFPADLTVPTLEVALSPMTEVLPEFAWNTKYVKMALRHARGIEKRFNFMTLDDIAAIVLYTLEASPREKSLYFAMNVALRNMDRSGVKPWRDFIWLLIKSLKKLPAAENLSVVRGAKIAFDKMGLDMSVGETITWSGFSSVTTTIEVMQTFLATDGDRTLVQIQLTEKIARDIQAFSFYPTENELLLPPNVCFEFVSKFNAGNGLCIVQAKQIESLDEILDLNEKTDVAIAGSGAKAAIMLRKSDTSSILDDAALQVRSFLKEAQLEQFFEKFIEAGFDNLELLKEISQDDLKELGLQAGHRMKFNKRRDSDTSMGKSDKESAPTLVSESKGPAKSEEPKSSAKVAGESKKASIDDSVSLLNVNWIDTIASSHPEIESICPSLGLTRLPASLTTLIGDEWIQCSKSAELPSVRSPPDYLVALKIEISETWRQTHSWGHILLFTANGFSAGEEYPFRCPNFVLHYCGEPKLLVIVSNLDDSNQHICVEGGIACTDYDLPIGVEISVILAVVGDTATVYINGEEVKRDRIGKRLTHDCMRVYANPPDEGWISVHGYEVPNSHVRIKQAYHVALFGKESAPTVVSESKGIAKSINSKSSPKVASDSKKDWFDTIARSHPEIKSACLDLTRLAGSLTTLIGDEWIQCSTSAELPSVTSPHDYLVALKIEISETWRQTHSWGHILLFTANGFSAGEEYPFRCPNFVLHYCGEPKLLVIVSNLDDSNQHICVEGGIACTDYDLPTGVEISVILAVVGDTATVYINGEEVKRDRIGKRLTHDCMRVYANPPDEGWISVHGYEVPNSHVRIKQAYHVALFD